MKIKHFLLPLLLVTAVISYGQKNAMVGTWKLVSGILTYKDTASSYGDTGESMKIITPTHFAVMSKDADGTLGHVSGGRVKMDATHYTETLDYSSSKDMLNQSAAFTYTVEGDKCHIKGGTKDYTFDEVWQRVQ